MKRLLLLLFIPVVSAGQVPYRYVDPLIGTGNARNISPRQGSDSEQRGQTIPAVGRPFGMTQWTPETRTAEAKCTAPYYYNDKYVTGFRGSHWMSGSCTQDYGSMTVMPFTTGLPDTIKHIPSSKFSHKNEFPAPAYYKVTLENSVLAELAASVRSGIMRFTFPGRTPSYIFIRMNSDENQGKLWVDGKNNEIRGYNPVHRIYKGSGKPSGFSGYFVIRFDKPFSLTTILKSEQQLTLDFKSEKIINVRIGTSFTSLAAAAENLDKEIPLWDLEKIKKEGEDTWTKTLGRIQAGEGSEEDHIKFYTALYHCYQLPRIASDISGTYHGFAGDTTVRKAIGFDYYDDFPVSNGYRVLHSLMTILEPERTSHMMRSLILKAEQGGWTRAGDEAATLLADAYLKGIRGFDAEEAWKYMQQNAFDSPSDDEYRDGKGRRALRSYLQYGYIPLEDSVPYASHPDEQVSRTLEYSFNDYALAMFAKALGNENDYQKLIKRSENWRNVYDRQSGFVRGKHADGTWVVPTDPYSRASFICDGTPFQYTWYVPHNIPALIDAMGGIEPFVAKLSEFFEKGHYRHGNESDRQAPYLFAMAGRSEKTQDWTARIIREQYGTGPGGLNDNEDGGQLSAWLVFSMMGFYPVCPASNQYVITKPSFDEVRILLPGNNFFLISQVRKDKSGKYVRTVSMNGGKYNQWYISHEDIVKGSRFTFLIN